MLAELKIKNYFVKPIKVMKWARPIRTTRLKIQIPAVSPNMMNFSVTVPRPFSHIC